MLERITIKVFISEYFLFFPCVRHGSGTGFYWINIFQKNSISHTLSVHIFSFNKSSKNNVKIGQAIFTSM